MHTLGTCFPMVHRRAVYAIVLTPLPWKRKIKPIIANPMQRINIIGTSGSGKSTFGRALANQLGYPFIELDTLFWQDDWQESSDEAFFEKITQQLAQPTWVLDGNYSRSTAIKWREVDTVIWLNYAFSIVFFRALKRALIRVTTKEKLWGTNNSESWRKLFSKDSIVWLSIKMYSKKRRSYRAIMNHPDYAHITFIELTSPKQAQQFLSSLTS